jgi:hypothetical protein
VCLEEQGALFCSHSQGNREPWLAPLAALAAACTLERSAAEQVKHVQYVVFLVAVSLRFYIPSQLRKTSLHDTYKAAALDGRADHSAPGTARRIQLVHN